MTMNATDSRYDVTPYPDIPPKKKKPDTVNEVVPIVTSPTSG